MTPENYLWYSKAVLATITLLTFLGIVLRWKREAIAQRPFAYMSLLLTLIYITGHSSMPEV